MCNRLAKPGNYRKKPINKFNKVIYNRISVHPVYSNVTEANNLRNVAAINV